jgi:hypothetical protein
VPQPSLVEPLRRWDPEQVGGYVLIGRLGSGAIGQVYLGRSPAGRLVTGKTNQSRASRGAGLPEQVRPGGCSRPAGQRSFHGGGRRG